MMNDATATCAAFFLNQPSHLFFLKIKKNNISKDNICGNIAK